MIIQYLVSASSFGSSGIPPASIKHPRKAKLIHKLVDIPKPLSIRCGGMISEIIFGVQLIITPEAKPNTSLPKHIYQKLRNNAMTDPRRAIMLNLISVVLLPFLMKSPPNMQPSEIPTIVLVVKIVVLRSIAYGSQFNWYFNAGITGPDAAIQKPNYALLRPIAIVTLKRYPMSGYGSSDFLVATDLVVFVICLVDFAPKLLADLPFLLLSRCFASYSSS